MMRWLDTLTNRTILLLLLGIGLVHVVSLYAYQMALDREATTASETRLADRLFGIRQAVMRVAPAERESVAHGLSGGTIEAHWSRTERAIVGGSDVASWSGVKDKLKELSPDLQDEQIVMGANRQEGADPHLTMVSMRLPDESWVNVSIFARLTPAVDAGHGTLISTTLMALGVIGISILVVRWMTQPLRSFADASHRLYGGAEAVPMKVQGPREVRDMAVAFNGMQERIKALVDSRTQTLAAVSHDLRTPLTRLRLKTEDIADAGLALTIQADLTEMEEMIDQTLAYLQGDRSSEAFRPVDLTALLATLADSAEDAGHKVVLEAAPKIAISARPLALKRAISNVIQNAVKYADGAQLSLKDCGRMVEISIADNGPGIASDRLADAFEPFTRIETSRSKDTGGFGLGLAISRAVIEIHGGSISLENRPAAGSKAPDSIFGGLIVRMILPKDGPLESQQRNRAPPAA